MTIVNYTQAIKLNPDDYEAYYQRAEMYEKVILLIRWDGCAVLIAGLQASAPYFAEFGGSANTIGHAHIKHQDTT